MTDRIDALLRDCREYVGLRTDALKLQLVSALSTFGGKLISVILVLLVGGTALLMISAGLVILISWLIDSLLLAFLIIGALLAVAAAVLWARRDRMFTDSIVRSLSAELFANQEEDVTFEQEEDYE